MGAIKEKWLQEQESAAWEAELVATEWERVLELCRQTHGASPQALESLEKFIAAVQSLMYGQAPFHLKEEIAQQLARAILVTLDPGYLDYPDDESGGIEEWIDELEHREQDRHLDEIADSWFEEPVR